MPLLDRSGWKADPYLRTEELPAGDALLVPLALAEEALAGRSSGQLIGAEIPNTIVTRQLLSIQDDLALIAVQFPSTTDGRGFSLGRMLREQGFKGILRASGELIPDQFAFALACGFDEVEISDERAARQPIEQWLGALGSIDVTYQAMRDGRQSIFDARKAASS